MTIYNSFYEGKLQSQITLQPKWFDRVQEEFKAARENVAICDYSSFAKLDIWSAGDEVIDFLQYLCSNDVDVPVGMNRYINRYMNR